MVLWLLLLLLLLLESDEHCVCQSIRRTEFIPVDSARTIVVEGNPNGINVCADLLYLMWGAAQSQTQSVDDFLLVQAPRTIKVVVIKPCMLVRQRGRLLLHSGAS
jgi:hypothetical protein